MHELITLLNWAHIDEVLNHIDHYLSSMECPVILRARTKVVTEELLSSLIHAEGSNTARVRCTFPSPQKILLQYRNEKGALNADLSVFNAILAHPCTEGVTAQYEKDNCVISVGVK